jgi:hypothetical protein
MRTIKLAHLRPLASGATRDVYLHPDDAGLLIKVIRRDAIDKRYGSGRPWYKTTRRYRHFISYLREIREEIALRAVSDTHPASLQKIVGFADTDLGFGLVVEAAKDHDGHLAPTLPQLIAAHKFDAPVRAALTRCLDELLASPIVLADLHGANLVYAWTPTHGDHFVLIDGIGCKTLIPFSRISTTLNRYGKQRRIARLWINIDRLLAKHGAAARTPAPERPVEPASG